MPSGAPSNGEYLFINSQFYSEMVELFHSVFNLPEVPYIEMIRKVLHESTEEQNQLFVIGLVNLHKKYGGKKFENLINIAMLYAPIPDPIKSKYVKFEKTHFRECKRCHYIYIRIGGDRSEYCYACKPRAVYNERPKSNFHTECMVCHKPLTNKRRGAKTCSLACRVALCRENKKKSISSSNWP